MLEFPTSYSEIMARLHEIDPASYGRTRNYLSGAVTRLSPYLTHGVITTQDVGRVALEKTSYPEVEALLRELAWRDFYRTTWEQLGNAILDDLRFPQPFAHFEQIPAALTAATTGIQAIDQSITELINSGYVHNHARLWMAMLCCTIARTAWWEPSRWMYYHLLDGDIASNSLSWQWVAGSCRKEPYVANQDNINRFSGTEQHDTFLDASTEELLHLPIPALFESRYQPQLTTTLPEKTNTRLTGEILLYHSWSLNPQWHKDSSLPRVLLLEPSHFSSFPMSEKRIAFILALAKNIPGLTVAVSDFSELAAINPTATFSFIHHPAVSHWIGQGEHQNKLFAVDVPVTNQWSFSKFWSRCKITLPTNANT